MSTVTVCICLPCSLTVKHAFSAEVRTYGPPQSIFSTLFDLWLTITEHRCAIRFFSSCWYASIHLTRCPLNGLPHCHPFQVEITHSYKSAPPTLRGHHLQLLGHHWSVRSSNELTKISTILAQRLHTTAWPISLTRTNWFNLVQWFDCSVRRTRQRMGPTGGR